MASALSHLAFITFLAPLLRAQPAQLGTQDTDSMLQAEQQAELLANGTLAKLVAFTANLRQEVETASWSIGQAHDIESHASAKISAARSAAEDDSNAEMHALAAASISETNLKLNDTEFGNLRAQRAGHMAAIGADAKKLEGLTDSYKNQLMKTQICGAEKVSLAKVQELQEAAQVAASDLAIIVGTFEKIQNTDGARVQHSGILKRSAQRKQQIDSEGADAKKLIQALPEVIVGNIDGMSGGCDDKAHEEEEKKKAEQGNDAKDNKGEEKEGEYKKDKKGKKDKGKKGKDKEGRGGKRGKRGKHPEELFSLVDTSAFPLELVADNASATHSGQNSNIDNLKELEEKATVVATRSVASLGDYLKAIESKDFGAAASRDAAIVIMKGIEAGFAKKRTATLADLEAHLKVVEQLSNVSDSQQYKDALTAASRDMSNVKQIGADEAEGQAPQDAAEAAESAEKARAQQIVDTVSASSQTMMTYASAVQQLQEKVGVNESDITARYARSNALSRRITQVTEDAQEVANMIIVGFYTDVKKHVAQAHVPQDDTELVAKPRSSGLFLDAAVISAQSAGGTPQFLAAVVAGGIAIAMVAALVLATQVRKRSAAINTTPLLG